jgi:hypothetical protein
MVGTNQDTRDVLVVAGNKWAYDCYGTYSAYITQPGRHFRPEVERMGYYANGAIQREFPTILARRDHVALTQQTVRDLRSSGDTQDAQFAEVVEQLIADGIEGRTEQIFLLSGPEDPRTLRISDPIRNTERAASGRRTAWTQGRRYVHEVVLLTGPQTTRELAARAAGAMAHEH